MSSIKQLKEKYDKVIIKYTEKSCEVMLVDGLNVYTGRSKCHDNDNFDRKLGRKIAVGRAEFASKVASGDKSLRESNSFALGGSKYRSHNFGDINEVDEFIVSFLPERKSNKQNAS